MADEAGRGKFVLFLRVVCVIQLALGIALFVCGGLAVRYTEGQKDTFGPPYFVGAFITGIFILIAGIISVITGRRIDSLDTDNQEDLKDVSCFMCAEFGLCVATVFGSFIGLFFVGIFGLRDCDPNEFGSFCNYTENIPQNKTTAIFILLLILVSVFISILSICFNCRHGSSLGINFTNRSRQLRIVGRARPMPVTTYQATTAPVVSDTGYKYSPVIIGGVGQNTAGQPSSYPIGTQPYQSQSTNPTIQELQEQNRLLQEQIRLQQQQLELQRQLQQQQGGQGPSMTTPMYTPPPPSYDQCTSDDATIRQMEEHNMELRRHCQQQQQELEKKMPILGPRVDPSAPLE